MTFSPEMFLGFIALAVGVAKGAQPGAYLSRRIRGGWIIRSLPLALGFVGIRLLITVR
jgi:hypothetical protein